ncbi:MAG: alkene reductase [Candidatus Omnitrophica bacterium]|nr:alkene reductase [Candidatus Omnitrophota bacterium]
MNIFSKFKLGNIELANRIVMAPMTRSRATAEHIPSELMIKYYEQRASAGLIITEGTSPSANGVGYPRIPGIYNQQQIQAWNKITNAVHAKQGRIFLQMMHTGRVSHPDNMPAGTKIIAPSAIALSGQMYTDAQGLQDYAQPLAMSLADIEHAENEYVQAAKNAIEAGFDGVEVHAANGYLINQFINPASNQRTDNYGGCVENRCRFAREIAEKVVEAIGADKTGIRVSPYGVFNGMIIFDEIEPTYTYLSDALGKLKLVYMHIVDHSSMGAPEVPESIKLTIRHTFKGNIIASGGLDKQKAEAILNANKAELTAFGKPFIANPDLVYKMKNDLAFNQPDFDTFYTPGEKGYTDYSFADK